VSGRKKRAGGSAAFFNDFKFFYKLIITHYSKFLKKISLKKLLLWRQILAIKKRKTRCWLFARGFNFFRILHAFPGN